MTPPSKCHGTAIKKQLKNGIVLKQLCSNIHAQTFFSINLLIVQVVWSGGLKAYYQIQRKNQWLLIYQIVVLSKLVHL